MAVHSKLSRVRFCHGKPKSIRRKESENIPNIINRTLSHVEIENFSSSLQYYRNYISKMGERKNSLLIRLPPRRSQIKKKAPWKIQIKPYCKMVWEKYEVLITCCVVPRRRWRAGASVCPWVFPNCLLFRSFWLCHVFIRGTPCCRLLAKLAGKWSSDVVCPLFAHHRLLVQTDFSLRPVPEELCENFDR